MKEKKGKGKKKRWWIEVEQGTGLKRERLDVEEKRKEFPEMNGCYIGPRASDLPSSLAVYLA